MSDFLGSRISLISKSDIRYVGTLHEINSDESTVSLENVRSFGTEGRKGRPEEEIAPSDQVYEYIIFRGSDVKDLRIEDAPGVKENAPPAMPEDPAILNARPRPGAERPNQPPGQPGQPGFGQPPPFNNQNNFYPPPGAWGPPGPGGRGGPGPGPGPPGNMPYPPPPGWFPPGHPGQAFPHPPGQWNSNNIQFPPGQHMPPGTEQPIPGQGPPGQGPGPQGNHNQRPLGPAEQKQQHAATPQQGAARPKSVSQQQASQSGAPTPPVESKPSAEEVKATAATLDASRPQGAGKVPNGPKNNRVTPVVPLATQKSAQVQTADAAAAQVTLKASGPTNASIRDATQAAKAAVAVAMANLSAGAGGPQPQPPSMPQTQPFAIGNGPMDNLTRKVDEMRVNAARGGQAGRGRGRGGRQQQAKVEVPDSDFDFDEANAKFNKTDLVKEAIAGSPIAEPAVDDLTVQDTDENPATAYNKKSSFFDNISSEAKDRADNNGQKPGGREWRGEEQRKNMETFGQGSVDGGHRGYRGRGRGRGRGFGRGRGGGGYRGRGGQAPQDGALN